MKIPPSSTDLSSPSLLSALCAVASSSATYAHLDKQSDRETGSSYPALMGILNITEDSFSDGALWMDPEKAAQHAIEMLDSGASIIDIGAESTRPGAKTIPEELEKSRIEAVLTALHTIASDRQITLPAISIDTRKSSVADLGIKLGATMINDISAMQFDPDMLDVLKSNPSVQVLLMHSQGNPETMQLDPHYKDVLADITCFLEERIACCVKHGISEERIIVDPGIGFGKLLSHNLKILANLDHFRALGVRIALGASRKSFINQIFPTPPNERLAGSLAAALFAIICNIDVLRVHDVKEHSQFFWVLKKIAQSR